MTLVQKQIRETIKAEGYVFIKVGRTSPCTMSTIKALIRAGYSCKRTGYADNCQAWIIQPSTKGE